MRSFDREAQIVSMTVCKFAVLEDQEWIFPVDDDNYETFFALDGRVIRDWDVPVITIYTEEKSYSDFPWLGEYVPILKKPAVDALAPVLTRYGQLLPLKGKEVRLFNTTTVLDVLDHDRSRIVYFDNGDILDIERHVFLQEKIGTAELFELPMRASTVYVTDSSLKRSGMPVFAASRSCLSGRLQRNE
jgi:hypothetical protein